MSNVQLNPPSSKLRSDYRPPDFFIDHVSLIVDLNDTNTLVKCSTQVKRNGEHKRPLVLDGEQLELCSVEVNGKPFKHYQKTATSLVIEIDLAQFELCIETKIYPHLNTSLEGLYLSSGAYCTQCEAEGFRKITYYLDRPDVLATFDVTITANQQAFPMLLANGNKVASGSDTKGRHWVKWQDPFKKPCYLFALVAGDFDLLKDTFTTQSGRTVALELFVDKGQLAKGQHALDSLKKAMQWDEEVFGLEYDLDIYMIVAVDFFNMGAMENKGLNVFNSKFVLASADTATDEDFFNIESVIAHEYFHNWTGNRVTCRDWFQLSLKEGLTVFRDQQFSADMASPLINRIKSVKVIRENQFAEDSSAMAHPIRPDEVIEMNNFYTVTVYDKGAEVIRMLHTLLGADGFRRGMDLYFQRFDGQAVTCDDFVQALEDANEHDLSLFRRWYSQSGTPSLKVSDVYHAEAHRYELTIEQHTKPTADQKHKENLHIPLGLSLLGNEGQCFPLNSTNDTTLILDIKESINHFCFENITTKPIPSLLHNFTAPVRLDYAYSDADLAHVMRHSPDDFARWDASQSLYSRCIHGIAKHGVEQAKESIAVVVSTFTSLLAASNLAKALKTEMLSLPSFETLFQQRDRIDIDSLYTARRWLYEKLATDCVGAWLAHYQPVGERYAYQQSQVEQRRLNNLCLKYLALSQDPRSKILILNQFAQADNMTDSLGALAAAQLGDLALFDDLMLQFEQKWLHEPLVLDKWFALHANTPRQDILARLDILAAHAQYSINNPNRVRSVVGSFAYYNVPGFHAVDGSGYAFLADYILKLNKINPQIAARLVTPLTQWQKVDNRRQTLMQHQLMRLSNAPDLSKDVFEKVSKSLHYTGE
jgi:aminopeptidase N